MASEPCCPRRLFYYYCTHLRTIPKPAFVIDISLYWPRKQAVIECYQSQFFAQPKEGPTIVDRLRDLAAMMGWSIGARYGEPMTTREQLGVSSFRGLAQKARTRGGDAGGDRSGRSACALSTVFACRRSLGVAG